jgi:hypothetical protein
MSVDPAVVDPRLKATHGQVEHMNRWFDREPSQFQLRQSARPSVRRRASAGGAGARARLTTTHDAPAHARNRGGHLVVSADLGWLVGTRADGQKLGPPPALGRARLIAEGARPRPKSVDHLHATLPKAQHNPHLTLYSSSSAARDSLDRALASRSPDLCAGTPCLVCRVRACARAAGSPIPFDGLACVGVVL